MHVELCGGRFEYHYGAHMMTNFTYQIVHRYQEHGYRLLVFPPKCYSK